MRKLVISLQKLTNGQFTFKKYMNYRTSFVKTLSYFFSVNQVYGPLFLACFLVVGLLSIMFTLFMVIWSHQMKIEQWFFLVSMVVYTIIIIFVIHWHLAKCIRRIHRPGRRLYRLMIKIHCRTEMFRVKMKLLVDLITFNVLDANRQYGFTYGNFGLISMIAFTKVCSFKAIFYKQNYH